MLAEIMKTCRLDVKTSSKGHYSCWRVYSSPRFKSGRRAEIN